MHEGFTLWFTGYPGPARHHRPEYEKAPACSRCQGGGAGRRRSPHLPSKGLGFSKEHRDEKTSAASATCANCSPATGVIAIAAAIRLTGRCADEWRARIPNFVEVYVECPVETLAARGRQGPVQQALAGRSSSSPVFPILRAAATPGGDGFTRLARPRKKVRIESGLHWNIWV